MITALVLIAAAALVASGLFSGLETGIYCLNRVRLSLGQARGDAAPRLVAEMMKRPEDLIITMLVGTTLADYAASAAITALLLHLSISTAGAEIYTTLIMTPLIFVLGNAVPKIWFQRQADRLVYTLSRPVQSCRGVLHYLGVLWMLRTLTHAVVRMVDSSRSATSQAMLPRAYTIQLLREGAARGGLSREQSQMIERVLRLSQVRCQSAMIPRDRCVMVPRDIPREDFLRVVRMAHVSRIPVYEKHPRKVVGVVHVFDVLSDPAARPISEHVRDAIRIEQIMTISTALVTLQNTQQTMAIVCDRRGDCVGILTVKDLVEEVVGDLAAW
jgi:CBS domain containing-hemolysin-like protein